MQVIAGSSTDLNPCQQRKVGAFQHIPSKPVISLVTWSGCWTKRCRAESALGNLTVPRWTLASGRHGCLEVGNDDRNAADEALRFGESGGRVLGASTSILLSSCEATWWTVYI